ncbi:hypothetical protein ABPG75_012309 [Micractinium tetrahymenae]
MPHGVLAVVDSGNACIRGIALAPAGSGEEAVVSTLAGACGEKPGFADGPAGEALFSDGMKSLVCLPNCSLLVGDLGSGRLRLVDIDDPQCPPRRPPLPPQLKWALAGISGLALIGAAVLAVECWAAVARRRISEQQAIHAVESGMMEGMLSTRQDRVVAARGFLARRSPAPTAPAARAAAPAADAEEQGALLPAEEYAGAQDAAGEPTGLQAAPLQDVAVEEGSASGSTAQRAPAAGELVHGSPAWVPASSPEHFADLNPIKPRPSRSA